VCLIPSISIIIILLSNIVVFFLIIIVIITIMEGCNFTPFISIIISIIIIVCVMYSSSLSLSLPSPSPLFSDTIDNVLFIFAEKDNGSVVIGTTGSSVDVYDNDASSNPGAGGRGSIVLVTVEASSRFLLVDHLLFLRLLDTYF